MFTRLQKIYEEFPRLFWVIVGVRFVDGIGGTLLFPFFALYITQKFNVGMTQAGILLGISSLFGLVGSMFGGALTDKFGRKQLILFGLVFSAISTLGFGLVNDLKILYLLAIVVGLLSSVSHPAHEAMIADILPEKKRQEGFGILRVVANIIMLIVYQQMYGSLSVYLRDNHGINPQGYGFLMSTSAITVIFFQFWLTRTIKHQPPFLMMAFGTIFYVIGFTLFGLVTTFILFALNIVIITIGEMIVVPTSQSLVAGFAPEEMRGRYMAVSGLSWAIPSTIGPAAAGYILDNYNPNLLWYIGGVLCGLSVLAYYLLHLRLGARQEFAPAEEDALPLPAPTD